LIQNNKLKSNVILCFLFLIYGLNAQPEIEWEKNLEELTNGGYIVVGFQRSNGLWHWGYFVIKVNEFANLETVNIYDSTGTEAAQSIQETINGNYICNRLY